MSLLWASDSQFSHSVVSLIVFIYSIQLLSWVRLFATPWSAACQASLSITNSRHLTQTHVHRVGNAIQPSHPLLSPSPSTFNLSQHQDLFQWVSSSHQVAKVLEFQLQHQTGGGRGGRKWQNGRILFNRRYQLYLCCFCPWYPRLEIKLPYSKQYNTAKSTKAQTRLHIRDSIQ